MQNETQPANTEIEQESSTVKLPAIIQISRVIAWGILISGAIGALLIYNNADSENKAYSALIAAGCLITAIITWAILSLIALNSENLFYIRCDLYYKNNPAE